MGTVRTTLLRPSSDACFQNDVPPRVEVTSGRLTGRKPHLRTGGTTFDAHARIRQVRLEVALRKSKMLCLPGFTPVAKLAQATGDSEGCVVSSFANVPCSESRFRFGSLPSSIHLRASVGSIPSKPRTNDALLRAPHGFAGRGTDHEAVSVAAPTAMTQTSCRESIRRF